MGTKKLKIDTTKDCISAALNLDEEEGEKILLAIQEGIKELKKHSKNKEMIRTVEVAKFLIELPEKERFVAVSLLIKDALDMLTAFPMIPTMTKNKISIASWLITYTRDENGTCMCPDCQRKKTAIENVRKAEQDHEKR